MDIAAVADKAGILGASGSGQPLGPRLRVCADAVIANGAECEPLLASDTTLMRLHAAGVLAGLNVAMGATGAARGYVAVREGEGAALGAMQEAARGQAHVQVVPVPDRYPIGDAHVLVPEVTGRLVPEGGRPEAVGVVVANVHSLWHLARAVQGQVVTWRYVTVGGEVGAPRVMRVPHGMLISDVLERCGGVKVDDPVFVLGGPMQGDLTDDATQPLGKAHSGLFVFSRQHPAVAARLRPLDHRLKQAASACAGCRRCTEYCPRGQLGHHLSPHEVIRAVPLGGAQAAAVLAASLCSGCGLCEVVCPAGLSPRAVYGAVGQALQARGVQSPWRQVEPTPREGRGGRGVSRAHVIERMALTGFAAPVPLEDTDHTPWRLRVPVAGGDAGAEVLVAMGERIAFGQALARPTGDGVWTHAPVPGVVTGVKGGFVALSAGG